MEIYSIPRQISDVRYCSDSRRTAALQRTAASGHEPTFASLAKTLNPSEAQRHEEQQRQPQVEPYHAEIGFSAMRQL